MSRQSAPTSAVVQTFLSSRESFARPSGSPVLPGVYSARLWVKQHNHACEVALERYAEPVSAFRARARRHRSFRGDLAGVGAISSKTIRTIRSAVVRSIRSTRKCAPASIGASSSRSQVTDADCAIWPAQVDQTCLPALPDTPESDPPDLAVISAPTDQTVLVYNPVPGSQTGPIEITVPWAGPRRRYLLLDERGQRVPYRVLEGEEVVFESRDIAAGRLRHPSRSDRDRVLPGDADQ